MVVLTDFLSEQERTSTLCLEMARAGRAAEFPEGPGPCRGAPLCIGQEGTPVV